MPTACIDHVHTITDGALKGNSSVEEDAEFSGIFPLRGIANPLGGILERERPIRHVLIVRRWGRSQAAGKCRGSNEDDLRS